MNRVWCAFIVAAHLLLIGGCSVAPLVRAVPNGGPSAYEQMPSARVVEAHTDDGVTLHGLYVPAAGSNEREDDREPLLILHLLPSSVSIESGIPIGFGRMGLAHMLNAFVEAGYSSVVFDYRGIGRSEGSRSAARLADDGRAMWRAAMHLAGDRPERIVIRAGSLGTLIAAQLLHEGARPGGAILYTPLRAPTITRHAAHTRFGPVGVVIAGLFRAPMRSDLAKIVEGADVPMLMVMPTADEFISPAELTLLAAAAEDAGHRVVQYDGDHQETNLRAWGFHLNRRTFSGQSSPSLLAFEQDFLTEVAARRTSPSN